ncbi:MAG: hypothetical protein N0E48_23030, partial [Candidatus Thiodiazotropha endolucinida]|nr:hypothetical protein [Candidatus Thiodiazotropha taylori]MCW4346208.1 hypothetical protein [Candidatus Thiodiazotropha endolucinida]
DHGKIFMISLDEIISLKVHVYTRTINMYTFISVHSSLAINNQICKKINKNVERTSHNKYGVGQT